MPPPLRRIPLLPLAGLGIVLLTAIAAILLSRSVASAHAWVNHSVRVQVGIAELAERLAAQESAYRGYMIRGDRSLLTELDESSGGVRRHLVALRAATADNPAQQAHLGTIEALVAERLRYMDERRAQRDRLGRLPDMPVTTLPRGRVLAVRIRASLAQMFADEQRLVVDREARTQRLTDALSIGLAVAMLLVVLVAYALVGDARQRFLAMTEANRDARAAAFAARAEMTAREEAETQLRQIQRIESLGQLTGGIAHDFNNMLAVIIGSLDIAGRRIDDRERLVRHIANAQDGARRAATLVARLLAFSRRQPLAPTTIDPNAMIGGMIELLERTLGEQIAIATVLVEDVWSIHVDAGQLENAILNMALNARDAMAQGGALTIVTENRTLDAASARRHGDLPPGDYVLIAICDQGSGMSEEVRAHAFDPFFTTKPVGQGTGLGLSQVFGFVKQSGGHVVIEPDDRRGTIVRVFLPRTQAAPPIRPADAVHDPAAGRGQGQRILVVEDDERVRLFSVEALRELGYTPFAADSGAAALELLRRGPDPDLLFTDLVMPGIGGPELVAIVRAARPDMKILFTTGYARDRPGVTPLDPDIVVLAKPFTVSQLAARVREALTGST